MSLETIVQNMVTAKEPEANIAQVIKHYNQINKSPLKQVEEIVESETIETPDCEAEGMVWSEEEQKCISKDGFIKHTGPSTIIDKGSRPVSNVEKEAILEKEREDLGGELEEVEVTATAPVSTEVEDVELTNQKIDNILKNADPEENRDFKYLWGLIQGADKSKGKNIGVEFGADLNVTKNKLTKQLIEEDPFFQDFAAKIVEGYGLGTITEDGKWIPAKPGKEFIAEAQSIISNAQKNSSVFQNKLNNYQKAVSDRIDNLDKERRKEEYGEGVSGAALETIKTTIPKAWSEYKMLNNASRIEQLNKEANSIANLPDGTIVNYGGSRSAKDNTYIGGKKGTKEEALNYLNDKLDIEKQEVLKNISTSQEYGNELAKFEKNEIFDKDGLTWNDFKRLLGSQGVQLFYSAGTLGAGTNIQEAGKAYKDITDRLAMQNLGLNENDFYALPKEKQAEAVLNVINTNPAGIDEAFTVGFGNQLLDLIGISAVGGAAKKAIPRSFTRALLRKDLKDAAQQTIKGGKTLLGAQTKESVTETGQQVVSRTGVAVATDEDIVTALTKNPKEYAEEFAAAFVTTGPMIKGGQVLSTAANRTADAVLTRVNPDSALNVMNILQKEVESDYTAKKNKIYEDYAKHGSKVRRDEELNNLNESTKEAYKNLGANKDYINNTTLHELDGDRKKVVFKHLKDKQDAQANIEAINDQIANAEGVVDTSDLKNQLKNQQDALLKAKQGVFEQRALHLRDKHGKAIINYIKNDTEGDFKDVSVYEVNTVTEAKKEIEDAGYDLKDPEVQNLLKGENNAVILGGKDIVIVEDNIQKNLKAGDLVSTNAIHHELSHFILRNATAKELNNLKTGIKNDLSNIKDPALQRAIKFADARVATDYKKAFTGKGRNKALAEEWFAALSDGLRDYEIQNLTLEDSNFLVDAGKKIGNLLGLVSDESLNFDMGVNNTLQFIKNFNKFNNKSKPINLKAPVGVSVDIEEVRASKPLSQQNINDQFKDLKKGEIDNDLAIQAAYAYEPLAQSTAAKIYKNYPEYSEQGYTLDDFANELTYGEGANSLMGLAKSYDPEIGSIGGWFSKYLPERAKAVIEKRIGKQVTTGATRTDAKEAKQVQDIKQPSVELKKPAVEALAISKPLSEEINKAVELGVINAEKKIKELKTPTEKQKVATRDKAINEVIKNKIQKPLKEDLLKTTKNKKEFDKYINKNWEAVGNAYLNNTDINKIRNPETKALLENWANEGFTKEDIANYFNDPTVAPSTRSDRKNVGLINAIVSEVSNEARIDFAKKDPATAQAFKDKTGTPLASKPLSNKTKTWLKNNPSAPQILTYSNAKALLKGNQLSMPTFETKESIKSFFKNITPLVLTLPKKIALEKAFYSGGDRGKFGNIYTKGKESNKTATKEDKKTLQELRDTYEIEQNKLFDKIKANKNQPEFYGLAQDGIQKDFVKVWGTNTKEIKKNINRGLDSNGKNLAIHAQVWAPIYNAVLQNPKQSLPLAAKILSASGETAGNWHRLGGEMVAFSKDLSSGIRYEHAMPAKAAYLALLESAAKGVPFDIAYPAVMKNYKVIALALKDDKKIQGPYKSGMGEGWNFYTDSWLQRYFNPTVAAFDGGINPNSIETLNGDNYGNIYNIKPDGLVNKKDQVKASKPLSKEFNKILERSKGVKAEAEYSEARAIKLGQKKGFQAFVPYSAEDYLGLIYPTLGKGKQGDKDLQWYKDNIMDPYNNGIQEFEVAKQGSMAAWNELKKQIKNTPANLKKEAVRGFNNEDAIRIYLWDKEGVIPSNLAKKDVREINKYINKNPELVAFANQVQTLNPDGYPAPNNNWLAGTITTDLVNHVNTVNRSEFLKPWQEAVDAIYTDANKNKLRATFGNNYIEALEDTLYRMKTGRNRPAGTNRITNTWLNWLNDSVGTVMFLNQRSALLQTISSINYLNWTDNNPAQAAKAFANQKQFWNDFTYLFNSDFLKQRRSGLKTDVNADEIAQSAATSPNKARAAASWLLKKGFLPTQMADSFAISIGGASFYRNRVNKYKKEGLNQKEAEEKAFLDFRNTTTEAQQSADPSRISMQQASPLGRVILAFANTPIQYTRLTKRAIQDLANKRGDWKTNVSKIIYYGAVQNIIFTALQQALFGIAFDDADEEIGDKEAQFRKDRKEGSLLKLLNSSADTILRGSGVGGAFVAMLKNLALEAKRQSEKSRSDYERVADKLFSFSPVIDSKFRKLQSAGRTFTYKQELKKIQERGMAIDNPALMAAAQTLSAFANVPLDRAIKKINNLQTMTEEETKLWQQIALFMGYGEWELGIQARKVDEERAKAKQEKAEEKKFKNLQKNIDKGTKKKSPVKALQHGVLGRANKDGTIEVAPGLSPKKRAEVIRHEKLHQKEMKSGKLDYDDSFVYYGKKKFARKNGMIAHAGKWKKEGDHSLPWEKFAHKHDNNTKIA